MSTLDSHLLFLSIRSALRYTRIHEHSAHDRGVRRLKREHKLEPKKGLKSFMRKAARNGDEDAKIWLRNKGRV